MISSQNWIESRPYCWKGNSYQLPDCLIQSPLRWLVLLLETTNFCWKCLGITKTLWIITLMGNIIGLHQSNSKTECRFWDRGEILLGETVLCALQSGISFSTIWSDGNHLVCLVCVVKVVQMKTQNFSEEVMLIGLNFCEFTCMRCYSADTVNPPISTQGAYFKFRRRRERLFEGGV